MSDLLKLIIDGNAYVRVLLPEFIPDRYFGKEKQFQSDG